MDVFFPPRSISRNSAFVRFVCGGNMDETVVGSQRMSALLTNKCK